MSLSIPFPFWVDAEQKGETRWNLQGCPKKVKRSQPTKLCDGAQMAIFWVLHFQRAVCRTFQTCIQNSH